MFLGGGGRPEGQAPKVGQGRGQRFWAPPPVPGDIPWAAGPGPWEAARAAAAGHPVSAGSREWTAGRWWGWRSWVWLPPSPGPRSRGVPAGVLPALATRGGPSSTHGPGSRDRGAVGAASGTTRLPIGKRGPLPVQQERGWEQPSRLIVGLGALSPRKGRGGGRRRTLPQGARLAAARVGTRGAPAVGRSARRPRRGVRLMDSAAREVAPRPLPPPPGCSPSHEPPELGSRSTQLAGAGTELLGE